MHCQLIALNCRYSHSCPALFYVRNELEQHLPGCRVSINQFTINDPYYLTLLRLSTSTSTALFFSVSIWNAIYIERLIRDLARLQPERPLILGGPQAPILAELPAPCTVVHGEIEGVGDAFYRDLDQGRLQAAYYAASGRPFSSPYRAEDFTTHLKNRQIYYESSRGCPFFCSYCLSSVKHGVFHQKIETVEQELTQILASEPKIIKFVDRTFNADPQRALTLWKFLASRPGKTKFHFEIAPDRFSEEMFSFLETVEPDLFQFEIGIQSTNPATLAAVNRHMDLPLASANLARLVQLDRIHLHVDLILGLPFETKESFQDSFNLVFALEPHYLQMGLLKVLPETALHRDAANFGMVFCQQPPYEILASRWLNHQTLSELHSLSEVVESFYNNRYFRALWRYLLNTHETPFLFFSSLLESCRRHNFFDLAHTQELMSRILYDLAAARQDRELLLELLRYDWLRCGHRFLPDYLENTPLAAIRNELWKNLPENLENLFTSHSRAEFFKRGVFLKMSAVALREIGLSTDAEEHYLCFLPELSTGVIKHSRVVVLA